MDEWITRESYYGGQNLLENHRVWSVGWKHYNTVDKWFRELEKKGSLDAIFEALPGEFDLRPLPEDKRPQNESQVMDVEAIKRELALSYEQVAAATMDKMKEELKKELVLSLPQPIDPLEERNRRLTEHITQRRVKLPLRKKRSLYGTNSRRQKE